MELQHPEDRAVHGELALAHVALVARLLARMEPSDSLVVCPTVYWGEGDEPYLARLGSGLDPRVSLFWTGRAICAPRIDLREAERFAATAGRPPLYWDNYPVNDVAMTFELHVGPYQGRDPRLATASRGLYSPSHQNQSDPSRVASKASARAARAGSCASCSASRS